MTASSSAGGERSRRSALLAPGCLFLVIGLAISCLGYASSTAPFNGEEVVGPLLFWFAVAMLLLVSPLRDDLRSCLAGLRTRTGSVVFVFYLALHLIVYGFLLEIIFTAIYGISSPLTPSLILATEVFTPASLTNVVYNLSFNPSLSFTLPPVLSGTLSAYAVAVALLVDVLIVANVTKTRALGRLCTATRRAQSFFLIPALGLILGASCCISVPGLLAYAYPSLVLSSSFALIYNVSYFLFPAFAILILYLNALSIDRISASLETRRDSL